jgi:hypothetical protein
MALYKKQVLHMGVNQAGWYTQHYTCVQDTPGLNVSQVMAITTDICHEFP